MVCIPSIQKPILLILLLIRYVCVSISPWSHVLILFPLALKKKLLFIVRKMVYILSDTKSESFNFTPHRYVFQFPCGRAFYFCSL